MSPARVAEVVPERKLAYSWKYADYPGESLVTIELRAEGSGTRLKLTHSGLETFQPESHPGLARKRRLHRRTDPCQRLPQRHAVRGP